ncbi:hypothetical protein [Ruminococcus sp.]|uniref:hypothetical protein n=1 Tax=Ruminococcus sp. TaxID=41978 RepID=UPI0015B6A982|nr:hypothetical protein [uncultured Ruminococcus sp.]
MNGFMYKVARFFQGRYGIDKLFYGICGVAVVLSAANLFVRSLILQLLVYAVLVLAVVRALSRNCQKRYEENLKFERAFGGIGRKFSLWKRMFTDRKTHCYRKCPVCKKMLRLPRVKGEHGVKCPNCANRFNVKI